MHRSLSPGIICIYPLPVYWNNHNATTYKVDAHIVLHCSVLFERGRADSSVVFGEMRGGGILLGLRPPPTHHSLLILPLSYSATTRLVCWCSRCCCCYCVSGYYSSIASYLRCEHSLRDWECQSRAPRASMGLLMKEERLFWWAPFSSSSSSFLPKFPPETFICACVCVSLSKHHGRE